MLAILDFAICTPDDTLESLKAWLETDWHITNKESH